MTASKLTIACFGATGGCVATTLACALKAGYHCTARTFSIPSISHNITNTFFNTVARTPDKLLSLLTTEHKISSSTIDQYLTIHQGDVKDPIIVSKALINPTNENLLVDIIVSGVGAYPSFQWSIKTPFPLTDPKICETAVGAMFTALSNLSSSNPGIAVNSAGQKPLLIVVSTAGCGRKRGVPLPLYYPYRYLLGSPLADKIRMEDVIFEDKGKHIRDFIVMRPLFLIDGDARGDKGLRVGWEWGIEAGEGGEMEKEPGPEIGYYVSRKDVGIWIFEHAIVQGRWEGKCVYVTY